MSSSETDFDVAQGAEYVRMVQRWEIESCFGAPWTKPCVLTEGGKQFVKIGKFDRGFISFCGGKLKFGQSGTGANVQALDELVLLRNKASEKAVEMVLKETLAHGEKIRKVRKEDKDLLDYGYVPVEFPEFMHEGISHGPLTVNCLWALKGKELHVEFSQQTFLYLRAMVLHEKAEGKVGRSRAAPKSPKKGRAQKKPKKSPKQKGLKQQC